MTELEPNISIQIGELMLDGIEVARGERPFLQATIESELKRLLADGQLNGRFHTSGAYRSLTAVPIQLPQQSTGQTEQMGQQIAASLYGALTQ